jgi:hypothetical protein
MVSPLSREYLSAGYEEEVVNPLLMFVLPPISAWGPNVVEG